MGQPYGPNEVKANWNFIYDFYITDKDDVISTNVTV
jgi:hypothetical protein